MNSILYRLSVRNRIWAMVLLLIDSIVAAAAWPAFAISPTEMLAASDAIRNPARLTSSSTLLVYGPPSRGAWP